MPDADLTPDDYQVREQLVYVLKLDWGVYSAGVMSYNCVLCIDAIGVSDIFIVVNFGRSQ